MNKITMDLNEAIEWAESRVNDSINFHVKPWNDSYMVISDLDIDKHPDTVTVYNTKIKRIDKDLVKILNSDFKDRHVRDQILKNGVRNPTYVCVRSYKGGPIEGEILNPYYESINECYYSFLNLDNEEVKYDLSKISRMCVYFKEMEEVVPRENKKITRKNTLMGKKK